MALSLAARALEREQAETPKRPRQEVLVVASLDIPRGLSLPPFRRLESPVEPSDRVILRSKMASLTQTLQGRVVDTSRLFESVRELCQQHRLSSAAYLLQEAPAWTFANQPKLVALRSKVETQSREADQLLKTSQSYFSRGDYGKALESLKKAEKLNRERSIPALTAALEKVKKGGRIGGILKSIGESALGVTGVALRFGFVPPL